MVAYLPFSGNANDASGNNNHGVPLNNPTLTTDRNGTPNSAYYFDGIDDYIQIANNANLNPTSSLSIALYFKPTQNGVQTLIGKIGYNLGIGTQFQIAMDFAPFPGVLFGVNPATNGCLGVPLNAAYVNSFNPVYTNVWYCVVGTIENGNMKIYLNGQLIQSFIAPFSLLNQCSNADIQIGSWWSGDRQQFKGSIDEVRIYDRALNAAEVAALCNNPVSLCTGSLGDPVVNIGFGAGNNPAQPLPAIFPGASTNLSFVAVNGNPALPTPVDGQYTVTNNIPFNNAWYSGQPDHTPNDVNGFMAFYNSQETAGLEFYSQTVNNLCGGTTYEFAAWIANCLNPAILDGVDPDITFRIEKIDGTLIGLFQTGPIPEETIFNWRQFGFFFTLPPTENSVVLKMINNNVGGSAQPGNDLAIDDITFRACGPTIGASLSNTTQLDTIRICAGTALDLYGQYNTGYSNAAFRWQQFVSGTGWIDLPSSNSLQIQLTPPSGTGNFVQYRMVAAESANINSPNCRVSSKVLYVWVNDNPSGGITADTVCANTRGHLTFQTTSTAGPFSVLYKDPFNIGYNQINMVNGSVFPTGTIVSNPTTFTLIRVTDANGCFSNTGFVPQEATVGIKKPLFNAPAQAGVCTNKSIQLLGNNGAGYTFVWSPATYLNNPTIADPICTPAATIDYTVRITEPVCNTDSNFAVTVTAFPLPVVSIVKSNDIDCARPAAQLVANGNGSTFHWSPATGLSRTDIRNPIANPDATTQYTVTAVSDLGCESNDTLTLFVTNTGIPALSVPNAFTPNNDGKNDCFGIGKWGYAAITEFSIYNRWGQKVFTTKNVLDCWDGRLKGVLQPSGGYSYVIRIPTRCGELKRTGSVLLIR